jgi:rRNA pseudouridine-1189 N-methylase Emg1 (Nep1/Mra1 family)
MTTASTIQLRKSVIEKLKKAKEYPRQTYNELVEKMTDVFLAARQRNQYDEFLHKVQQQKMRELWNNKEDEAWEHA